MNQKRCRRYCRNWWQSHTNPSLVQNHHWLCMCTNSVKKGVMETPSFFLLLESVFHVQTNALADTWNGFFPQGSHMMLSCALKFFLLVYVHTRVRLAVIYVSIISPERYRDHFHIFKLERETSTCGKFPWAESLVLVCGWNWIFPNCSWRANTHLPDLCLNFY